IAGAISAAGATITRGEICLIFLAREHYADGRTSDQEGSASVGLSFHVHLHYFVVMSCSLAPWVAACHHRPTLMLRELLGPSRRSDLPLCHFLEQTQRRSIPRRRCYPPILAAIRQGREP